MIGRSRVRSPAGTVRKFSSPVFFGFFLFFLSVLNLIRCSFHPRVTAVARKRPLSFCQKCRWQVPAIHANTFNPSKSEWLSRHGLPVKLSGKTSSHATHQETLIHSRPCIFNHDNTDPCPKSGTRAPELIST